MKLKTLALIAASSAMTLPAFAADPEPAPLWEITTTDTLFGTNIDNTATLTYSIAGQTDPGTASSEKITFEVDRKVIFSLTPDADTGTIIAGEVTQTVFTLQNDSNAPIDFKLPDAVAGTTYLVNGNALAGGLTFSLEKGDLSQTNDTAEITVKIEVAEDAGNGTVVTTSLKLVAVEPTAEPLKDETQINSAGDVILASNPSAPWLQTEIQTISIPTLYNAPDDYTISITKTKTYTVSGAIISLKKEVSIVSDPINATNNPKAIPGAVVKYTLTVINSGFSGASGITVADIIPSELVLATSDDAEYKVDTATLVAETSTLPGIPQLNITDVNDTKKFSFTKISVAPATKDINDATVDAITVVSFTVQLP